MAIIVDKTNYTYNVCDLPGLREDIDGDVLAELVPFDAGDARDALNRTVEALRRFQAAIEVSSTTSACDGDGAGRNCSGASQRDDVSLGHRDVTEEGGKFKVGQTVWVEHEGKKATITKVSGLPGRRFYDVRLAGGYDDYFCESALEAVRGRRRR